MRNVGRTLRADSKVESSKILMTAEQKKFCTFSFGNYRKISTTNKLQRQLKCLNVKLSYREEVPMKVQTMISIEAVVAGMTNELQRDLLASFGCYCDQGFPGQKPSGIDS